MKNEKTKTLVLGAMMVALTAVLMLICRYVPVASLIGTFVCGIPMAAFATRSNIKALVSALVAVFALSVFIDGNVISAISTFLMSVLPGAVAGYMLGLRKTFFTTLFATCLAVCVGWIFELLAIELFIGNGIDELLSQTLAQMEESFKIIFARLGEAELAKLQITPEQFISLLMETARYAIKLYFPSFVVIASLITGYVIIRVSAFVINRAKLATVNNLPFSLIKAPRSMSTVGIICYIIFIFMNGESAFWSVLANVVMILYTIIGICGLSFVDFKFKKKIPFGFLRFLIYMAVIFLGSAFMSIISSVLIIIGILDASRDFRHIDTFGSNF